MKIKTSDKAAKTVAKMNPHKTRREKMPECAKGLGKMGMNKTTGSKKTKGKSY